MEDVRDNKIDPLRIADVRLSLSFQHAAHHYIIYHHIVLVFLTHGYITRMSGSHAATVSWFRYSN